MSRLVAEGKSGIHNLIAKSVAVLEKASAKFGGSMTVQKRGRKRIKESRAAEIRARLVQWRQIPEPQRISLRALAAEIGTSHQMLSFYLRGLDKWQASEYQRQAKAICDRADAENRSMSESEMAQGLAYQQAASRCLPKKRLIDEVLAEMLFKDDSAVAKGITRALARKAQKGDVKASQLQVKFRRLTGDDPTVPKIPRPSKRPQKRKGLDVVLKELEWTTDSEKYLRLIRQLTLEERKELWALQEKRRGERDQQCTQTKATDLGISADYVRQTVKDTIERCRQVEPALLTKSNVKALIARLTEEGYG